MVKDGIVLSRRYEVLSKLGAGGMADVYKGRDKMLNRYVAIKVLKKEYREDEGFVKKFRSEAQAAAGLMHPNIVNVYDVGEDRGLYYMVMELVEGITLKEYIRKKKKLDSREVVSIAIQMCSGIEAAHNHNIIHRDIKPQNIIISKEGKVKVTDFGIAKAISSNTVSSNAMGSVHYVSPEQARGGFCDEKSDIYSVGIVMYEMVTGKVPFDGDSTVAVAMKHLQEVMVPPSEESPEMSRALEAVILKCTQKSPERRYQDMAQLLRDLKKVLVDPDGDFVKTVSIRSIGETTMISQDEMNRIKKTGYRNTRDDYDDEDDGYDYEDDEADDDEDDRRRAVRTGRNRRSGDLEPGMNKMMKILTIVVAVIIALIMLLLIAKATGIFRSGSGDNQEQQEQQEQQKVTTDVEVPNLIGEKEVIAKEICTKKNLVMEVTGKANSDKYPEGVVISQTPEKGNKVAKKTVIQVVISSGAKQVAVADVTGLTQDEAWKVLKNQGFTSYDVQTEYSDQENGKVVRTTPAAGENATIDTKIVIVISKGIEKKEVPNIVGKGGNEANALLQQAGFGVGEVQTEYSDTVAEGVVISQTVSAGKRIDAGSAIGYTLSLGKKPPEQVKVPAGLCGKTLSDVKAILSNVGLSYKEEYVDSPSQYGIVVEVYPLEEESVDVGSTITLKVSNGSMDKEDKSDSKEEEESSEKTPTSN